MAVSRRPNRTTTSVTEADAALNWMDKSAFATFVQEKDIVGYTLGTTTRAKVFQNVLPIHDMFLRTKPGESGLLYTAKLDSSGSPDRWSSSQGIPVTAVHEFFVWKTGTQKKIAVRPVGGNIKQFMGRLLRAVGNKSMDSVAQGSALGNTLRRLLSQDSTSSATTMNNPTSKKYNNQGLREALSVNEPFKRFVMRLHKENEVNNNDLENAALLVRMFGTPREIDLVDKALFYKKRPGYKGDPGLSSQVKMLHDKYYRQLTGLKPSFPPMDGSDDTEEPDSMATKQAMGEDMFSSSTDNADLRKQAIKIYKELYNKAYDEVSSASLRKVKTSDSFSQTNQQFQANVQKLHNKYVTAYAHQHPKLKPFFPSVTEQAMGEAESFSSQTPTGFYVMGKTQSVGWYKDRAEAEKVAKQMNYRGGSIYTVVPDTRRKPGMTEAMATKTFTVMAIDDSTPAYKRNDYNYKPSAKVLDQMRTSQDEITLVAKDLRRKFPKATISVENKGGKIVKVFKPGEMIKERRLSVTENTVGLPKAWLLKAYDENKKNKNQVGNAIFLTRLFGTPAERLFVDELADKREKEGFIDPKEYGDQKLIDAFSRLEKLHDKYYAVLKSLDESRDGAETDSEYGTYYGNDDEDDNDEFGFDVVFDDEDVAEDDDQSMMLSQLDAIQDRAEKLYRALRRIDIDDVPAWIQDKVSVSDHNMSAILDYFMYESKTLREAVEDKDEKEIPWMLQPAHIVARMLGGAGYSPVGTKPEDVVNNAILAFLRGSHTTESWKMAGAALNSIRDVAGVNWNTNLIKPAIAKAMGISEPGAAPSPAPPEADKKKDTSEEPPKEEPAPEPKAEPKPEPKAAPKQEPAPDAEPDDKPEPRKTSKQDAEPQPTNEDLEIEIKVGKPMKDVTFAQKKEAALAFAEALCPGMNPNGITPEQVVNNAVSTWFFKRSVPLEQELAHLGKALKLIDELGIQWNPHLIPAPYMAALKMPNVKVSEVEEPKDTSAAGKKVDKLETILLDI